MNEVKWKENVILVDADHADQVAFDLTVNFERMLERRVPKADMARWLECVAMDGGLRPESPADGGGSEAGRQTQVVLMHRAAAMENFRPGGFGELDGQAFAGPLGEFLLSSVAVGDLVTTEQLMAEALQVVAADDGVRCLVVVPGDYINNIKVREALRQADRPDRRVTVLTMQPGASGPFRHEVLGYSLMAALGISADEIQHG